MGAAWGRPGSAPPVLPGPSSQGECSEHALAATPWSAPLPACPSTHTCFLGVQPIPFLVCSQHLSWCAANTFLGVQPTPFLVCSQHLSWCAANTFLGVQPTPFLVCSQHLSWCAANTFLGVQPTPFLVCSQHLSWCAANTFLGVQPTPFLVCSQHLSWCAANTFLGVQPTPVSSLLPPPKVAYGAGPLIQLLLGSGAHHYLEFKLLQGRCAGGAGGGRRCHVLPRPTVLPAGVLPQASTAPPSDPLPCRPCPAATLRMPAAVPRSCAACPAAGLRCSRTASCRRCRSEASCAS